MRFRQHLSAALVFAVGIALSACSNDSKVNPPTPSPVMSRPISLLFVDAATNAPITAALRAVARDTSGNLSTVTQDRNGAAASSFTTSGGTITFQVDSTNAQAQNFIVVASADGYNSTSVRCDVPADSGYQNVARMVRIGAPPVGVSTVQGAISAPNGVTSSAITVATPAAQQSTSTIASLTVPANTTIKTADGTPLTGNLIASVSYFNNQDSSSLGSFPGGLAVTVPSTPSSNTAASGSFISGGFTAIEIKDGSGNVAKTFNQPVAVRIDIAPGTLNPETGNPLVAGDVIPLWSYDEATGQWKLEQSVTVQSNGSGGLEAVGSVSHLSYWNLDWFQNQDLCPSHAATITISGNDQKLPLLIEVKATGSGYYHATTVTDATVNLVNPLIAVPTTITASYNGSVVGSASSQSLCGSTVPLSVSLPVVQAASLTVHVRRVCSEDPSKTAPVPSVGVYPYSATGVLPAQFTDTTGTTVFSGLAAGQKLYVSSENVSAQLTLSAGSNSVDVSIPWTCTVTGAAGGTP
jgi:hypothetical protein